MNENQNLNNNSISEEELMMLATQPSQWVSEYGDVDGEIIEIFHFESQLRTTERQAIIIACNANTFRQNKYLHQ